MASENVKELTDTNFDAEVLKSDVPTLVDFWAVWCGPCKQIAPTVDALANEYKGRLKVADGLASLELGNYAEPEERAPVVAQKRAACEAAHVTKDEATCLDAARDTYSAARCVPRMFPALATGGGGDCGAITAKVRAL